METPYLFQIHPAGSIATRSIFSLHITIRCIGKKCIKQIQLPDLWKCTKFGQNRLYNYILITMRLTGSCEPHVILTKLMKTASTDCSNLTVRETNSLGLKLKGLESEYKTCTLKINLGKKKYIYIYILIYISHCAKERYKRKWSVLLHSLEEGHFQISFTASSVSTRSTGSYTHQRKHTCT